MRNMRWMWFALVLVVAAIDWQHGVAAGQLSMGDLLHPKQTAFEKTFCSQSSPLTKWLGNVTATGNKATGGLLTGQSRQFEIGLAMSLCHGGFRVAGTLYGKLSERDRVARQQALDSALAQESQDKTAYVLPDHPEIVATVTPVSNTTENGRQCAVLQDGMAEASENETALNKFCRTPPSTKWERQTTV